jgi:hypothetical protein
MRKDEIALENCFSSVLPSNSFSSEKWKNFFSSTKKAKPKLSTSLHHSLFTRRIRVEERAEEV